MATLRVSGGTQSGGTLTVDGEVVLRRGEGALAEDTNASATHARLWTTPQGLAIQDLGSTNGTWVNGARIESAAWLRRGDTVLIGATSFVVEDDAPAPAPAPVPAPPPAQVAPPTPGQAPPPAASGVNLFQLNKLVINQRAKVVELSSEYRILDEHGHDVGVVRQEQQSTAKKLLRLVADTDALFSHTVAIYDLAGTRVLALTKPRHLLRGQLLVRDGNEQPIGQIQQQKIMGKIWFSFHDAAGSDLGSIRGENWRGRDFSLQDSQGVEVGRVTKQWRGLLTEAFTTGDNYLVEISPAVQGPLRALCLAAGVGIDLILKQQEG